MTANLADSIRWQEAAGSPVGGTHRGVAAVHDDVFLALATHFPEWTVAIDELIVDDDTVIGLGTFAATSKTTGRAVITRVAQIWRVRNEKVVEFEHIIDTAVLLEAMMIRPSAAACTE